MSWRVLARRLVYDNPPWLRVETEDVDVGGGRIVPAYPVLSVRPHAVVFAITATDEVLAVRSYRRALDREDVALPAGYLEAGEDPLVAAQRELLEETGYEATTWSSLGSYVIDGNYGSGRAHIFLAEGAREVRPASSGDLEEMTVLRFPLADVLAGRAFTSTGTVGSAAGIGLASAVLLRRRG